MVKTVLLAKQGMVVKQGVVRARCLAVNRICRENRQWRNHGKPLLPGLWGLWGLRPTAASAVVLKKDPLSCVVGARGVTRVSPFVASPENFVGQ